MIQLGGKIRACVLGGALIASSAGGGATLQVAGAASVAVVILVALLLGWALHDEGRAKRLERLIKAFRRRERK